MRTVDEENTTPTKRSFLYAAIKCFGESGLQKTTLSDICKMSNMRSGHIYYYFRNKDAIIEEAYRLVLEEIFEGLRSVLKRKDIVSALVEGHRLAVTARREWNITPGLRLEFDAESTRNDNLRLTRQSMFQRTMAAMEEAAAEAIAAGQLSPELDPSQFALAMATIWSGLGALGVNEELDIAAFQKAVVLLLQPWIIDDDEQVQASIAT